MRSNQPNQPPLCPESVIDSLSQNILWMKKHNKYERQQRAELLDDLLRLRPTRDDLVKMHILIEKMCDTAEEAIPAAFQYRQDLRNLLCEHLKNRPTLNNLVENHIITPVSLNNHMNSVDNSAANGRTESLFNAPLGGLDGAANASAEDGGGFCVNNPGMMVNSPSDSQGLFLIPGTDQLFQRIGNNLIPCGKLVIVENKNPSESTRNSSCKEASPHLKSYFNHQPRQKTYNFHEFSPDSPSHRLSGSNENANQNNTGHASGGNASSQSHSSAPSHHIRFRPLRNSLSNIYKNYGMSENRGTDMHTSLPKASTLANGAPTRTNFASTKTQAQLKLQKLIDEQAKSLEHQIMLDRHMKAMKVSKGSMVSGNANSLMYGHGRNQINGHYVKMMRSMFDQAQQNYADSAAAANQSTTPGSAADSSPGSNNENLHADSPSGSTDQETSNGFSSIINRTSVSRDDSGICSDSPSCEQNEPTNVTDPFSSVMEALDGLTSGKFTNEESQDLPSWVSNSYINLDSSYSTPYSQHRTCFGCGTVQAAEKCTVCGSHTTNTSGFSNTSTSLFSDTSEFTSPCSMDLDFIIDPYIPFPSVSEKVALYEWIASSDDKFHIRRKDPFSS